MYCQIFFTLGCKNKIFALGPTYAEIEKILKGSWAFNHHCILMVLIISGK